LEQETAMSDMTTTRPDSTPHVFKLGSARMHLFDSSNGVVTTTKFASNRSYYRRVMRELPMGVGGHARYFTVVHLNGGAR
jgi:hypothetical protein